MILCPSTSLSTVVLLFITVVSTELIRTSHGHQPLLFHSAHQIMQRLDRPLRSDDGDLMPPYFRSFECSSLDGPYCMYGGDELSPEQFSEDNLELGEEAEVVQQRVQELLQRMSDVIYNFHQDPATDMDALDVVLLSVFGVSLTQFLDLVPRDDGIKDDGEEVDVVEVYECEIEDERDCASEKEENVSEQEISPVDPLAIIAQDAVPFPALTFSSQSKDPYETEGLTVAIEEALTAKPHSTALVRLDDISGAERKMKAAYQLPTVQVLIETLFIRALFEARTFALHGCKLVPAWADVLECAGDVSASILI